MIMKVVIATHNKDKLKELKKALSTFNVELLDLSDFPEIGDIEETGITLKENAFIKAQHVNEITKLPAIADDTGLEVDYLDGAPGVYSARFAGENCNYMDNVKKMLKLMKGVEKNNRQASFRTVIAFFDGNQELYSEGEVKGFISQDIKGLGGFGYDSIFYIPDERKTFAEMTLEEKNIISHRGKAIQNFKPLFKSFLNAKTTNKESA